MERAEEAGQYAPAGTSQSDRARGGVPRNQGARRRRFCENLLGVRLSFRDAFGLSPQAKRGRFVSTGRTPGASLCEFWFLTTAHNSLNQRLWIERGERGYDYPRLRRSDERGDVCGRKR
jgi:hypothetical protein